MPNRPLMQRRVYQVTHRRLGWGDKVAQVAQPVAKVIDRALGTQLQTCGGCKRRQRRLNRAGAAVTRGARGAVAWAWRRLRRMGAGRYK